MSNSATLSLGEASRVLALPVDRIMQLVRTQYLELTESHGDSRLRRAEVDRILHSCEPGAHHHAVQLFERQDFLADVVAHYLAEGLEAGAPLIIIARSTRLVAFAEQLERDGYPTGALLASGQLQMHEASEALASFMVDGMPDALRFRNLVGPLVARARAAFPAARLRAYGEMVDILWSQGHSRAAIRLEQLWNRLAAEQPFSLLCAYAMDSFGGQDDQALFSSMCETHSHVWPTEQCLHAEGSDSHRREVARLQHRVRSLESQESQESLRPIDPGPPAACHEPHEYRPDRERTALSDTQIGVAVADMRILVVDDDRASRRLLVESLFDIGGQRRLIYEAASVAEGLARIEVEDPALCICDFRLGQNETALDLYRLARARGSLAPFVGITASLVEEDLAERLLVEGFEDVVLKRELDTSKLYRIIRNASLRSQNIRRLVEIGSVDDMTGALNRRACLVQLETERRRCANSESDISLLYLDLNKLKRVNDQHGHAAGDRLIKALVRTLRLLLRECDTVGRLGGDEFCVVLPGANGAAAQSVVTRLHEALRASPIEIAGESVTLSVSIGVYSAPASRVVSIESMIDSADTAMMVDKRRYLDGAPRVAQSM